MDTWQDGEEEHWIEMIRETRGKNFVVDCELRIKVFDNSGNFEKCFRFQVLLADNKNIRNSGPSDENQITCVALKNPESYKFYKNFIRSETIK